MIVKIDSNKMGHVAYTFDNGNRVSFGFSYTHYADNYYNDWEEEAKKSYAASPTVEVHVTDGHPAFYKWMERKYDYLPTNQTPVSDIPLILKRADSKAYKLEEPKGGEQ